MDDEDENKGPAWKARLAECGNEALPIDCPLLESARSVELDDEGGRGTNDEDEDGPGCMDDEDENKSPGCMDDEDENKGPAWKARLAECGTEALPVDCPLLASIVGRSRRAWFGDEGGGWAKKKR